MKRTYMLVVLMLSALCIHAQYLEKNPYKRYTTTFSQENFVSKFNGEELIATAQKGNLKEVDNILSRFPYLANASLMVYPKNQVAQPLMCQLIKQGKKEMVNLFFKHGFSKNHKCPNGKGETGVMTLLEKSSNPNMYCYLLSQKKYPALYNRIPAQIKKASSTINLPCLEQLMEKDRDIAFAVYDVAKTGNSTAIKLAVKYLAKIQSSVGNIGEDVLVREYVKTGDRSLIDPFYDKIMFTPAQWNKIATDARRKNSFAAIILPSLLLSQAQTKDGFIERCLFVEKTYETFVNKMANTQSANDVEIYNIIYKAYRSKLKVAIALEKEKERQEEKRLEEAKHQAWLKEFGENAPAGLAAKFRWAEKKGYYAYYYPSGVRISELSGLDKEYVVPVVVVVQRIVKDGGYFKARWVNITVYNMQNEKVATIDTFPKNGCNFKEEFEEVSLHAPDIPKRTFKIYRYDQYDVEDY